MRCGPDLPLPVLILVLALLAASPARADGPAAEAEGEKMETDPKVIEEKVERILEEYEAIRSNQDLLQTRRRRELARRLGTLPHPDSIRTLLAIVDDDPDLRAKIFAMNSLARVGDLKAIKRLYRSVLKQARNTVLPDYFGPAMTKAADPDVGPWLVDKVLDHPNDILQMSAIEAVGALRVKEARAPLFEILRKIDRKVRPDLHMRYEVLRALGFIGGEGVKELLHGEAKSEEWRNRLAVAEVLPVHFRDDASIDLMRALLDDDKPIVREVAAVAAGDHKLEPLLKELVVLMREGNLRAKKKAYEALCAISGEDFGYAPDVWDQWLRDRKKPEGEFDRGRISVATYYDFEIFSDRVLFIVDVSGSMNWPSFDPNRIAVAKRELLKAIEALDEKTLFNLATFAGHVNMWHDGEVPATKENKKKAVGWIEANLLPRGGTNTYLALMEGLARNPEVDTIYFLSDGIPSTGKFEVPEEILIKLRYANRFRKVIFHTIAVAIGKPEIEKAVKYEDPEEMAAFMKMIADWNGGTCLDIRKPYLDLREDDPVR